MDKNKISHNILNTLERLRVMQELLKSSNFRDISKEEIEVDLKEALAKLEAEFRKLLQ